MKKFEFKGDWETSIESDYFWQLNSEFFFRLDSGIESRRIKYQLLQNRKIKLIICDERNDNIDPEPEQLNTINYILNNEEEIYNKVFESFKNKIVEDFISYPFLLLDGQTFHLIERIEQLPNHLGINDITITNFYDADYALFTINFEFDGNYENGLSMVFNRDKFLIHDEKSMLSYQGLVSDQQYKKKAEIWYSKPMNKFYEIDEKFGKNKPWKQEANWNYIRCLINSENNRELITLIDQGKIKTNEKMDCLTITEYAASVGKHEILKYFISKGWDLGKSIPSSLHNLETLEFLLKNNANIDELNHNGVTSLFSEIYKFSIAKQNFEFQIDRDERRILVHLEEMERHKSLIIQLLKFGADPYNFDMQNRSYKELLLKSWNEEFLNISGIFKELNEIIQKETI